MPLVAAPDPLNRTSKQSCEPLRDRSFLTETGSKAESKVHAEYTCRIFRTAIIREEMDLLCFNSERREAAG